MITVPTARMRNGDFGELVGCHSRSAGGAGAVSQQSDSGQPVRPDRDEVHGALPGADQRRPGQQLREHHRAHRRTARRPTCASTTGSATGCRCLRATPTTTSIRSRRRPARPTRTASSRAAVAAWRFRDRTSPRRTASRATSCASIPNSLISEFKVGYLKADIQSLPLNYGTNLSQQFGIPGVNVDEVTSGLALMTLTGYAALGDSTFIPLIQIDDTWQFNGSVTKTLGAHNIKFGGAYISRQFVVVSERLAGRQLHLQPAADRQRRRCRAATPSRRSCSATPRRWRARTR